MIVGYRLRQLRKEKRMSQEDLGKKLNVSKVSISGYETGNRIPSLDIFIKLLDIFDVSSDYLLGREVSMVCEDSGNNIYKATSRDIEIIKSLKDKRRLYSIIGSNPKRYFSSLEDKY